MIDIKITYKGKQYKDLKDAVKVAAIDAFKEHVLETLRPFEYEIKKHGGYIEIDIPKNIEDAHISVKNLPQELHNRIVVAFEE